MDHNDAVRARAATDTLEAHSDASTGVGPMVFTATAAHAFVPLRVPARPVAFDIPVVLLVDVDFSHQIRNCFGNQFEVLPRDSPMTMFPVSVSNPRRVQGRIT